MIQGGGEPDDMTDEDAQAQADEGRGTGVGAGRADGGLLDQDEPSPVEVVDGSPTSPFFITCDHAGRRIPRGLGTLGVPEARLESHIAWDLGAAGVARRLGAALEATVVLQRYSRLVIDCNRPLAAPDSIVALSEGTAVPGNREVSAADADRRASAIFRPYHDHIARALDDRRATGQPTILVAMHSFTPVFHGVARPWHIGVLYQRDPRLAVVLRDGLRGDPALVVGDNQPYSVSDLTDYGLIQYGERRRNPHVELELRQDLIAEPEGQQQWANRLAELLRHASTMFPS
jgi:predicted N-formylglutamate amidohydrolase